VPVLPKHSVSKYKLKSLRRRICNIVVAGVLFIEDETPLSISVGVQMKVWECAVCGFIYDEAAGIPEEGIPAGTRWEDIPDTWICPDCGAGKSVFEMIELE
jgi:rubredoxin